MFVEKPVTLDLELAKRINKAAEEKGIITAVGFQCRYDDINDETKKFIAENPIALASGSRVGGFVETDWFRKKSLSGGQLVEQTVHQMDILRYFLGEPASVYSVARRGVIDPKDWPGYDIDDISGTLITFENGIVCDMLTGCYSLAGASWDSKIVFGGLSARLEYILTSHI
jgi:predicted dehydrogenase